MEPVQEEESTHPLLNTPVACVLCLQDNKREDDGDPVENLIGMEIDVSSICSYERPISVNICHK